MLDNVLEKDSTLSNEAEHNAMLKDLGATIGVRVNTGIVNWALGKWRVSEEHFAQDVRDSFELLNEACAKPGAKLPGKPVRHLRNVLAGCPTNAGLGIDQQVLYLWSKLPDEALKGLLIIRAILDGKCLCKVSSPLLAFLGSKVVESAQSA